MAVGSRISKCEPYNAFKAEKAAECRANGETKNVTALHDEYHEEYMQLTDEEKAALIERHTEAGFREPKIRRDTPKAKIADVSNTVRNMQLLLHGLNQRVVGIEAFFCVVRNSSAFHIEPHWYFTSKELEEYMEIATRKRWNTAEVGAGLEAFAIAGCDVARRPSPHVEAKGGLSQDDGARPGAGETRQDNWRQARQDGVYKLRGGRSPSLRGNPRRMDIPLVSEPQRPQHVASAPPEARRRSQG
ncbi:hypothetical protein B0H10DRAFT_1957573 [Mycena sp. CBHHK59/15]|nr:hypothetical protein B0H10DRAFT_1957573 [Mycena sp. CBHHK59/15]